MKAKGKGKGKPFGIMVVVEESPMKKAYKKAMKSTKKKAKGY